MNITAHGTWKHLQDISMKKEPQIFVRTNKQKTPVSGAVLDFIEAEEITEGLLRAKIKKKLRESLTNNGCKGK